MGNEDGSIAGGEAHRELLHWLWAQKPPVRLLFEEIFTGPHGYAFVATHEGDGAQVVFVRDLDADGLIRHQRAYRGPSPAG